MWRVSNPISRVGLRVELLHCCQNDDNVRNMSLKESLATAGLAIITLLPVIDLALLLVPGLPFEARAVGLVLICPSIPCAIFGFAEGLSSHIKPGDGFY